METSSESWKFELTPYSISTKKELPKAGLTGDVGHFGSVAVERCPLYRPLEKGMDTVRLSGPAFPETSFRGKRRLGQPSLFKGELILDGRRAELRFNTRALRKKNRALRIAYEGQEYIYSVEGLGKAKVLEREGAFSNLRPVRCEARGLRARGR